MKALFSKPWFLTLLGFALIGALLFAYTTCSGPESPTQLTRKQEKAANAQAATNLGKAAVSIKKAESATGSATTDYRAGQQYEAAAIIHHKISKPHAPTPITSATLRAADSLLANY